MIDEKTTLGFDLAASIDRRSGEGGTLWAPHIPSVQI